ncbi:hypothetical protein HYS48_00395 [Candidatus Woesearchaeota archaeon]|nr:hypothetical protein [Candidatus Woesearchaeota archaeon]
MPLSKKALIRTKNSIVFLALILLVVIVTPILNAPTGSAVVTRIPYSETVIVIGAGLGGDYYPIGNPIGPPGWEDAEDGIYDGGRKGDGDPRNECVKDGWCSRYSGENEENCPEDCGGYECGDGKCEIRRGEKASECPKDCGVCGNNICEEEETPYTCSKDCPKPTCGDGRCEGIEDATLCYADCGGPRMEDCGNNACDAPWETPYTCPKDCKGCGNGICDLGVETAQNCPYDCDPNWEPQAECGNGKCEIGETPSNCSQDCKEPDPAQVPCGITYCPAGACCYVFGGGSHSYSCLDEDGCKEVGGIIIR